MITIITYKGRRYHRSGTNPKYYYNDVYVNGKRKKIALHRQIYIDNYGPIPEGHDVHHIDENTLNNLPENLKALPLGEHRSGHMNKRLLDPEIRIKHIKALSDNRHKSAKWHASKEGIEWHKINGVKSWQNRTPVKRHCGDCENEFETIDGRKLFCSNKCWQRARRKRIKLAAA